MTRAPVRRRVYSRRAVAAAAAVVVVVAGLITFELTRSPGRKPAPVCRVALGPARYTLRVDQAANATSIAAVGKRLSMPDHAITIALAVALQESGLQNLTHGDRDSLGLFQQRPSQGWGTASEVLDPRHAATAFFQHLTRVSGWESLPVTVAAQRVQHSASPSAYARWEAEARAVAQATTGEIPAGLSCGVPVLRATAPESALTQTVALELGRPALDTALPAARGWTVATWLVAHATQFGITSVTFDGQVWTPGAGRWLPSAPADSQVRIGLAGSA